MDYTISAVERALQVLKTVGENPGQTITGLAALTDNNKSLIFRILHTLEQQGFIIKDPKQRSYTLGYSALSLISHRRDHFPLLRAAEPVLDRMARKCEDNINLIIRQGTTHITVASRRAIRANELFAQLGRSGPLHAGGAPKVLLAFAPPEIRRQVLEGPLVAFNERTLTDPVKLGQVLDQIAETGENENFGDLDEGGYSIATVIRGGAAAGDAVAALSIAGYVADLDPVRRTLHWKLVREGAREIAERLGFNAARQTVV